MAELYLFGGPNGAGKTTSALRILPTFECRHFLNADMLAQGFSPLNVEGATRAAGRIMLEEMESHLAAEDDFALETTLSSRTLAPFVRRCKNANYRSS